ncbi:hypothetical protein L9F63_005756, partial [Diploptera punctata]
VLPVLKNTSNIKPKDVVTENLTSADTTEVQAQADIKSEVGLQPTNTADHLQSFETAKASNVNSDNESITSEPKVENYDLYEIVGDLSKSILNQLTTKPEYKKLSSNKTKKNLFHLESIMTPSAAVDGNEDKKDVINIEVS